jgi:hypothetical protein
MRGLAPLATDFRFRQSELQHELVLNCRDVGFAQPDLRYPAG